MNKNNLFFILILTSMFCISLYSENYENCIFKVENYIKFKYPAGSRASKSLENKLNNICKKNIDEKIKISELKKTFPEAFKKQEEPLIYTKPISWNIHSLSLGYDIQESASRKIEKVDILKNISTGKENIETSIGQNNKTNHNTNAKVGTQNEISLNPLSWIEALFNTKIRLAGSYTYDRNKVNQNAELWSKSQQEIFSKESNRISKMLQQTNINNYHLTFTVTINNNSNETIYCDLSDAYIPVYKGAISLNKNAIPFDIKVKKLEIPSQRSKDIIFRMELDNTTTRSLASYMENNSPEIDILKGGNLRITTARGINAIDESRKKIATSQIQLKLPNFTGSWNIRTFHTSNDKKTTLQEGLLAINDDFKNSMQEARQKTLNVFNLNENNLIAVSEIPFGKFCSINQNCNYVTLLQIDDNIYDSVDKEILTAPISNCTIWVIDLKNIEEYKYIHSNLKKEILSKIKDAGENKMFSKGNSTAQYLLANIYYFGSLGSTDHDQALIWYQKAATQGHSQSQYFLGDYYDEKKEYKEAIKWYRMAAKHGIAGAEHSVGIYYYYGDGVEKNYVEAVKWFKKAAEKNYTDSQRDLAYCYENGFGVNKDIEEAKKWYRKAAKQGDKVAKNNLEILLRQE